MTQRQYEHTEQNQEGVSIEKVEYGTKTVLLRNFSGNNLVGANIVVVGFVVEDYMKPWEGTLVPITEIDTIKDMKQREELTNLLKQTKKGLPINFWD